MPTRLCGSGRTRTLSILRSSISRIRRTTRSANSTRRRFTTSLAHRLNEHGAAAIQSTSPLYARKSYWCIVNTVESAGLHATPYHVYVPSFGEWGFVLATKQPYSVPAVSMKDLKFVSTVLLPGLFQFPADMSRVDTEVNHLNNQILVRYYESEWHEVSQ